MEETFLKPFQVSPRVLASTHPLHRRWLGPEPVGFTTRCHCSLEDRRRWRCLGTGSAVEGDALCFFYPQRGFQIHPTSLFLSSLNPCHPESSALSCQMSCWAWKTVRFCSRFVTLPTRGLCPAFALRDLNPPAWESLLLAE